MVSGDSTVNNYSEDEMGGPLCFSTPRTIKRELSPDHTLLGGDEVISASVCHYEPCAEIPDEAIPLKQDDSPDESRAQTRSYKGRSPRQTYGTKKKRPYISSARKLQVVECLEAGTLTRKAICEDLGIHPNTLYNWVRNKTSLESCRSPTITSSMMSPMTSKRRRRNHNANDLDELLVNWTRNLDGFSRMDDDTIKVKAEEYALQLGIQDFIADGEWISQFKSRHMIQMSSCIKKEPTIKVYGSLPEFENEIDVVEIKQEAEEMDYELNNTTEDISFSAEIEEFEIKHAIIKKEKNEQIYVKSEIEKNLFESKPQTLNAHVETKIIESKEILIKREGVESLSASAIDDVSTVSPTRLVYSSPVPPPSADLPSSSDFLPCDQPLNCQSSVQACMRQSSPLLIKREKVESLTSLNPIITTSPPRNAVDTSTNHTNPLLPQSPGICADAVQIKREKIETIAAKTELGDKFKQTQVQTNIGETSLADVSTSQDINTTPSLPSTSTPSFPEQLARSLDHMSDLQKAAVIASLNSVLRQSTAWDEQHMKRIIESQEDASLPPPPPPPSL